MRIRLALVLWIAGMPGVIALILAFVHWMPPLPEPIPMWVAVIVGIGQNGVLLAVATAIGARLAPQVDLHAPTFAALADRPPRFELPRSAAIPTVVGGAAGSAVLVAFQLLAPETLAPLDASPALPLIVRILYGGITEEILVRWGLMSFLVWLGWRTVQRGRGRPSVAVAWTAIVASAVAFGAAHLPAVSAIVGTLTPDAVAYVVVANAAFGIVAGWLFLRHGLEAAIGAHIVAHVGAAAVMWIANA